MPIGLNRGMRGANRGRRLKISMFSSKLMGVGAGRAILLPNQFGRGGAQILQPPPLGGTFRERIRNSRHLANILRNIGYFRLFSTVFEG